MKNPLHRSNADKARAAAAASNLPNVRERELRSADAHDAAATREENSAAKLKVRQAETAQRRASGINADEDENDDGGDLD
ncbi:hypothetical protein ACUXST_001395 [Sphingomonas sp. F9_3S_D5_B_2]